MPLESSIGLDSDSDSEFNLEFEFEFNLDFELSFDTQFSFDASLGGDHDSVTIDVISSGFWLFVFVFVVGSWWA